MQADFLLLGGDARQAALAALLAKDFSVQTLDVPGLENTAAPDAARLVLPIPTLTPDGQLRGVRREILLANLRPGATLYGGALGGRKIAPEWGAITVDLLADEYAVAENARLTADAALLLVMQHTQESMFAKDCCVIGCGRIGRLLCARLRALGAVVTAVSAKEAKRAMAEAEGFSACAPEQFAPRKPCLIFNTAPAQLLPAQNLQTLPPESLWVELASAPGGLPAGQSGFRFAQLPAGGLPGKLLPVSAAAVLYRAILRSM